MLFMFKTNNSWFTIEGFYFNNKYTSSETIACHVYELHIRVLQVC